DPLAWIVRAHLPADGERKHLRQYRHNAICLRAMARLGDLAVKRINVAPSHLRRFHAPDGWPDVTLDDVSVVVLRVRPSAADMLLDEALDQSVDGRCTTFGFDLCKRIPACIDLPSELARLLPPRRNRPVGKAADGEPALAASTG